MAFTFNERSASISTTPVSLTNGGTTQQANTSKVLACVFAEGQSLAFGDSFVLAVYEKTVSSGSAVERGRWRLDWLNTKIETPLLTLGNGWDWMVWKESGTDRTLDLSLRTIPE